MDISDKRRFKEAVYAQFARIGKALSSGPRLELLDVLAQGERTVAELADLTGLSVANASQHLQVLRRARLVDTRKEGTYVHYRLTDERVFRLWQLLRALGEDRLAEIDRIVSDYRRERRALEAVDADELRARMQAGTVEVIDVRPVEEYRAGHIAGARSMPLDELEARMDELPSDVEIVAYCRGPYCVFADEAVERLRTRGFAARRLDVGFPDWKAAELPVETTPA